ncbi:hypothetical protein GCM10027157_01050 [Corynebacterium aquatimens]
MPNDGTERSAHLASLQAFHHPRRIQFNVIAAARAVAMALERPGYVIIGLSALMVFGLGFFGDACDTTLAGPVRLTKLGMARSPTVFRRYASETWTVFYDRRPVAISAPAVAVVDTLKHLRSGFHQWPTPAWFADAVLFRAISLIDATRRHLGIHPHDILDAARGKVDRKWLLKALRLSSELADSPKETEVRMLLKILLTEPRLASQEFWDSLAIPSKFWAAVRALKLQVSEQVPVFKGERLITVLDLALVELKIAIMYDGEHHLARKQRDRDARIYLELEAQGWIVLRLSANTLADLPEYLAVALRARVGGLPELP